ncbi:unnamed protein product [Coregonus sp. 'balchen']|nr:unnamed protein product [Coregonus sp. 'balchen']
MSDIEDGNFDGRDSRSPSKSDRGSPVRVKSESRSGSPSPSRAAKHSESRSRSKSRSHSRRHSNRRYSRSRSTSNRKKSRSYSPEYRKKKSQSASPNHRRPSSRSHDFRKETFSQGGGGEDARANPDPNQCLGVFGLSLYTTEKDLREVFGRYGPLAGVNVVYDQRTGRSRGFAFVYFERIDDSKEVWDKLRSLGLSQFVFPQLLRPLSLPQPIRVERSKSLPSDLLVQLFLIRRRGKRNRGKIN